MPGSTAFPSFPKTSRNKTQKHGNYAGTNPYSPAGTGEVGCRHVTTAREPGARGSGCAGSREGFFRTRSRLA